MYRGSYGYRSSLNQPMVRHLRGRVEHILKFVSLDKSEFELSVMKSPVYVPASTRRKFFIMPGLGWLIIILVGKIFLLML